MPHEEGHILTPFEQVFGTNANSNQSSISINPTQQLFNPVGNSRNIQTPSDVLNNFSFEPENFQGEEETGLFNKVLNTFAIPQQVLFSVGKNLGEMFSGVFTGDFGDRPWLDELFDAAQGKSKLSFHDVLKSVGAEGIDLALPEWLTLENPWIRIPAAIALGIGAAVAAVAAVPTGGASLAAFAGITSFFAGERILGGQGAVSSVADVVLDPLNKLRLFQATSKFDDASRSKSILRQLAEGDRRLFDLKGEIFGGLVELPKSFKANGFVKKVDKVSEYMTTRTAKLHDTAIAAINSKIGQPILKYVDPVTGYVHRHVGGVMRKLFVRNGDMAEATAQALRETQKLDNAGKIFTQEELLKQEAEIQRKADETRKVFSKAQDEAAREITAEERRIAELFKKKTQTERQAAVGEVERTAGGADPEELGLVDLTPESLNETLGDTASFYADELQLESTQAVSKEVEEFVEFKDSIDEFKSGMLASRKERQALKAQIRGGDTSPESLQRFNELTVNINEKQFQLADLNKRLGKLEDQIRNAKGKGKTPAVARGIAAGEVRIMRKLLENVFDEDSLNRVEIFYESTGGARDMINGSEEAITAALLTKTADSNIGDTSRMLLRVHRSATTHEAFNLVTNVVYDNLGAAQKNQLLKIAQRTDPNFEAGNLKTWFQNNMYKAGIHAVQVEDKRQRDFVSRMLDGVRMFFRKIFSVFKKEDFDNTKVFDWLKDFSHNVDHFSNIKKTGVADISLFQKAETKSELFELLTNVWARMESAQMLAEGSAYNVSRNGAIWMPLVPNENKSAKKLRRAIFDPSIVSNTTLSPHRSIGTISLQNVKEEIIRQKEFILKHHILSEKEFGELRGVIDGPNKDLNNLIKPGTVAGELYEKVQRHMDLIPLEHFTMDEAAIRWHVVQSHRNITSRQVIDHIRSIGVRTKDSVDSLKQSILNNIDRVWLDPDINRKASIILRNIEKNVSSKEGKESLGEVFKLLNKTTLTIREYAKIAHEMENLYPFISGLDAQKLKVFLPKAKDFELGKGLLNANRGGEVQSLGRLLSPELAQAAIVSKVFDIEKILDPKLFKGTDIKAKFLKKKVTLKDALKGDEAVRKVFDRASTFDEIFDTQIFKEIEEKGRGKTRLNQDLEGLHKKNKANPQGFEELPVRKDLLEGSQFIGKKEAQKLIDSGQWVEFKPNVKDGQLPPAIQALDGLLIPKELSFALQAKEIHLPKLWRNLARLWNGFVKGIEDETAQNVSDKGAEVVERLTGIKAPEKLKDLSQRFFSGFNFDYMTLLFKAQALVSPAFHSRNYISGMVVNFMHGMSGEAFVESFGDMWNASRGRRVADFEEFRSQGLTGGGFNREVLQDAGDGILQAERNSLNPFSLNTFTPYKWNFKIGAYVEDAIRYSAFKHARKKLGLDVEEATNFVKALHFDYSDLSDFERAVMKRLIPFYTYWRKAIVRDSRMFMERTGNMFKMTHLIQNAESDIEPEQEDSVAFWVKQRMGVPFRRNPDTGAMEYFLLSNWIPAVELAEKFVGPVAEDSLLQDLPAPKFVKNLAEQFLQQANPLFKVPIEQVTNFNSYFGKKIKDYQGEESDFFGLSLPAKVIPLIRSIRFLNDFEKALTSLIGIPNSTRPDLPRPPASQALFGVLTGGRIVSNDDPQKNIFINTVLPERELKALLNQEIRRAGPNSENAQQLFKLLREAQQRRVRAFQGFKPPQPKQSSSSEEGDALQRLFANPNPENL